MKIGHPGVLTEPSTWTWQRFAMLTERGRADEFKVE